MSCCVEDHECDECCLCGDEFDTGCTDDCPEDCTADHQGEE